MCAEYKDERGYWICPEGKPNHHWDIAVYGLAGADITRIASRLRPHAPEEHNVATIITQPPAANRPLAGALPGWFRNRR